MTQVNHSIVREIVSAALREDIGEGDITTDSLVPESTVVKAEFIACESCVVAGIPVLKIVYEELDPRVAITTHIEDSSRAEKHSVIAGISGPARAILTGERVALNFLQRLSSIATLTTRFVEKVKGTRAKILDTRKTTPGLRYLEKYAVVVGGGQNHRMGLYDAIMIKDNHLKLTKSHDLAEAIQRFHSEYPGLQVEVETESMEEVRTALAAGADIIMLDNMGVEEMTEAVKLVNKRTILEASGGMTLARIAEVAATGVDWISIGALTSSAPAIDIKLEFLS